MNNYVAVNTPVGQTARVNMERIMTQGGTFGPIECSNSIDKIGKKCLDRGKYLYTYKKLVNIMPLSVVDDLLAISLCGQNSLEVNTFINTQVELKKLKFHTPDKNGKSKCHKIHIGKKNHLCPQLQVHGTKMVEVTSDTYLGDLISNDGKNSLNIRNRIGKGIGKISEIFTMLEKITLGEHYFATALLLRESMFLSSILTNSGIWYGLTKADTEELEQLDTYLLRKIMNTRILVPTESLFLELGCLNIGTIIKARRINYLHYLVTRDNDKMLAKFFQVQWKYPTRGDWVEDVRQDLIDFGINESLDVIKSKSEYSFKNLVKKKAYEYAFYSFLEKKESHSKLDKLFYTKLDTQPYLKDGDLSKEQAQLVFSYRVRMADYSDNYQSYSGHTPCALCLAHLDCQAMSFGCPTIKENVTVQGKYKRLF